MIRGGKIRNRVLGALGLALLAECLYFLLLPRNGEIPQHIDLIVVFQGAEARSREAYHLMRQTEVAHFFVPGATRTVLQANDKLYGTPEAAEHVYSSQRTHSTCEDAVQTQEIIRRLACKRVVLITSDYHVPRSLFLLRLLSLGSGCQIQPLGIAGPESYTHIFRKNVNEMIKLWGSLLQLSYHGLTGHHLSNVPQLNQFFDRLAGWLLL